MALTGLDIFKLLPKTNCGKCGRPTCLAFAMALAGKKASLAECPHISDEAKAALDGASAPPMKLVKIGTGNSTVQVGQETVLFRHDEKFHNPTAVAVRVTDDMPEAELRAKVEKIDALRFERIGQKIAVNLVAVENRSGAADKFAKAAKLASESSTLPLVLMSSSAANLKSAAEAVSGKRPLLYGANKDNFAEVAAIAKARNCPLVAVADGLEALAELTDKIKKLGVEEMVLDTGAKDLKAYLHTFTLARRACLKKNVRALGYPTIAVAAAPTPLAEVLKASALIAKYAGIVVLDGAEPWQILPVLTARQNIYTDPQKPIQVEPGVYKVGEANESSPLLFTTNFSLTYFTVQADVEASRIPCWILVVNTEGLSVLTAYSGDKLNEKIVAEHMKKFKVEEKVKHRKLIIPGYVSVMSGKLEEASGWEVLVGPKESSFIPKYLKTQWKV